MKNKKLFKILFSIVIGGILGYGYYTFSCFIGNTWGAYGSPLPAILIGAVIAPIVISVGKDSK